MGCKGCGKNRRHSKPDNSNFRVKRNDTEFVDTSPALGNSIPGKGFGYDHNEADQDPLTTLIAAKKLSYEDLTERRKFQQQMIERNSEAILDQMSEAMKMVHVDELVAVVNCERVSIPGMTPGQAIVSLKEALDREDFNFVDEYYPGLRQAVESKYKELMESRLPTRS